jgi:hypothetical protein
MKIKLTDKPVIPTISVTEMSKTIEHMARLRPDRATRRGASRETLARAMPPIQPDIR